MTISHRGDLEAQDRQDAAAFARYREAVGILEKLLDTDPSNNDALHSLAVAQNSIGYMLFYAKDLDGSLAAYRAGEAALRRRSRRDPDNAAWVRDISLSVSGIADVQLAKGDAAGAAATYRLQLDDAVKLAAKEPASADLQRDVAIGHASLGKALQAQNKLAEARVEYEAAMAIHLRLLANDPKDARAKRSAAVMHNKVGDMQLAQKDKASLETYRRGRAMIAELLAVDPNNGGWLDDLAVVDIKLANAAYTFGDMAGARQATQAAIATTRKQLSLAPEDAEIKATLAGLEAQLATCCK
jgi:tetratricopeptide (TPR) repeat protein